MLELHHAVPMLGAALVTVNVRLSAAEMAEILWIIRARRSWWRRMSSPIAPQHLASQSGLPCFIAGGPGDGYESWLADAAPAGVWPDRSTSASSWRSTTPAGRPGGPGCDVPPSGRLPAGHGDGVPRPPRPGHEVPVDAADVPLNGWCFTWAVTAAGGTHVCLRAVDPAEIWRLLRTEGITHLSAAPTVLTMSPRTTRLGRSITRCTWTPAARRRRPPCWRAWRTAPRRHPPVRAYRDLRAARDQRMAAGMGRPRPAEQAMLRARQGAPNIISRPLSVLDAGGHDVPPTGTPSARSPSRERRHARLLPGPRGDAGGPPQRLLPDRRSGRATPGRLPGDPRPGEGHHHLRGREHRFGRGRAGPRQPSFSRRKRRHRDAGPALGGGPRRLRGAQEGRRRRGRSDRVRAGAPGPVQGPQALRVRRPAEDIHGKIQKNVLRERANEL